MAEVIGKTILVVDDDHDIRDALDAALSSAGYGVRQASNGRIALDLLESGLSPDAILTDLMMPVLNGLEFLEIYRTRQEWKKIPVVVASANRGYDASDLGVAEMLRKPFSLETLLGAIDRVLQPG
jgi:CheY-like chemotaxis protein